MSDVEESSSVEAPTGEPVSAPRQRESVLLIIGGVAVVVAVGVAVVGFVLSRHGDERMIGPSGAFPSPVAVPAQPHAVRRAAPTRADDPVRGMWRRPVPHGLEPHAPTVVDHGRVYLLAAEHDNSDWQLIVTDLRTGKPLAHIPLPNPAGYRPPPNPPVLPEDVPSWADGIIRTVTDGIIVTGDSEAKSGTVDLLVQQ